MLLEYGLAFQWDTDSADEVARVGARSCQVAAAAD